MCSFFKTRCEVLAKDDKVYDPRKIIGPATRDSGSGEKQNHRFGSDGKAERTKNAARRSAWWQTHFLGNPKKSSFFHYSIKY